MGSISRVAEKCQVCPDRDKCNHKYMEACAYIDEPQASVQPQISFSASFGVDMNGIVKDALAEMSKQRKRLMNGVW